ncbi:MAG TPA: hypothetical protein VGH80_13915 [Xanthomonadaceae bacterium]|jgi:hypothetical protein
MRLPIIASTVLALAACDHQPPAMPTHAFNVEGVTLKLDPPAAPDCKPSTNYRAVLTWTVDPNDTPKTDVRLDSPTGKLFARSNDSKAHAETGDWVRPGMWFMLVDRQSGKLLGAVQAGPKPCP